VLEEVAAEVEQHPLVHLRGDVLVQQGDALQEALISSVATAANATSRIGLVPTRPAMGPGMGLSCWSTLSMRNASGQGISTASPALTAISPIAANHDFEYGFAYRIA